MVSSQQKRTQKVQIEQRQNTKLSKNRRSFKITNELYAPTLTLTLKKNSDTVFLIFVSKNLPLFLTTYSCYDKSITRSHSGNTFIRSANCKQMLVRHNPINSKLIK